MPFYAVAHGFAPAIYEDWTTAKKNIDGFPQPVYKKFESKDEAEEYFAKRRPESIQEKSPSSDEFKTFYAVARGKHIGIFGDYDEVKKSIADYPQPLQKKFTNLDEAVAYYEKFAKGKLVDSDGKKDAERDDEAKGDVKKAEKKEAAKKGSSTQVAFYAVARGHKTGVFATWNECKEQTTDFKGAKFKKFDNEADAKLFAEGKTLKQIEESHGKGKRPADSGDSSSEDDSPKKKAKK